MILLAAALVAAPASAQWTVIVLDPPGTTYSECNRIQDGQQIGYVDFGNGAEAAVWSGSAGSFVDLHPGGAVPSQARGVQGGRQVGHTYPHAGYWTGSAGSWVDLAPTGSSTSIAYDIAGDLVAGEARFSNTTKATIWSLSGGGWTDLHPVGTAPPATYSSLHATDGVQQAGSATLGGNDHAMVWAGSNTSWVDLHPAAATSSYALDVDAGQQVGAALYGFTSHAALWNSSAASYVDLQPAGVSRSTASGVHQGQQVGEIFPSIYPHAALWSGSAASLVDLHAFLPAGWSSSQAFGIWHDILGTTYVVGVGHLGTRNYAVMWVKQPSVWSDLGFAKAGGGGVSHLTGSGPLTVGSLASLALTGANPSSTSVLVLGVLPAYVPFLGGVLVPDLMILSPLLTDPVGAVTWQVTVPGGLPPGLPLRFQHWTEDPAVSFGYSASNGVLGILQ